ncbi:MAG: hypothetical protein KBD36_02655 [Alphaproteobacteria bacterium]|nr:hypothetical protein [Alphaproteobacteria bacterium]
MHGVSDPVRSLEYSPCRILECCLPHFSRASAPQSFVTRLNTQPMHTIINASQTNLRTPVHDSCPVWVANPSLSGTFIRKLTRRFIPAHGEITMNTMNTINKLKKPFNDNSVYTEKIKAFCLVVIAFLLLTPEAFGVADAGDAGFNASSNTVVAIINNKLVPITLIAGCLASAALAFMKSSPAPFVIAILTTISFGFAKVWINTTYAICV